MTAAEVVIVTLILAAGILPLWLLFRKSGETGYRSEVAYKAIQVAREELEAIRLMPLFPGPNVQVYEGHEWEPVAGKSLFFRELGDAGPRGGLAAPELTYPDHYRGIETRVGILPPPIQDQESMDYQNTRIVRLEVRWKMAGQAEEKGARGTQVYHITVSRRPS